MLGHGQRVRPIARWRGCRPVGSGQKERIAMKNILVAYDGGEPAHRALEAGIELARRFDASLAVVSVIPVHPGLAPFDPWDDRESHEEQLREAREILASHGIVAEMIEPTGDPARAIERVAAMGRFDTIVVGTRGLDAVSRFLKGSVSAHVATHAQATVVVAR
jgi:nucleotide-binding universal stress UspA family protein